MILSAVMTLRIGSDMHDSGRRGPPLARPAPILSGFPTYGRGRS
jgi:hypothetical protein